MSDAPVLRILPPDFLTEPALAAVMAALPEARVIGGAVRDTLASRAVTEIDLATPRTPEQVTEALLAAGIRAVPTGIEHGTVTAVLDRRGFEVTTLRRDVETDGRHAVVAFTGDWRADAARRDFTINAMSLTRTGEVFDYFGGVSDLHAGVVRFVGDPATRISRGLSAHPAVLPVLCALWQGDRRCGGTGGDPRRCAGSGQTVGRAGVERACANPVGARSTCRRRADG